MDNLGDLDDNMINLKQEVLGRTNSPTFPTCHLLEFNGN
jgi:hypothetical protein